MAKQSAGRPVPNVPSAKPTGNPGGGRPQGGKPVSPAVARVRKGPPAAQGHGGGK